MYHAIGKDKWIALPGLFPNPELAATLENDKIWWCWMLSYPHDFLKNSDGSPQTCTMDYGIKYGASTKMFWKFMRPTDATE